MRTMNNPYNAEAIADDNIIFFIKEFRLSQGKEGEETIKSLFRSGYSYAFASMLNKFFTGGTICWVAPFSHVVIICKVDVVLNVRSSLEFSKALDRKSVV